MLTRPAPPPVATTERPPQPGAGVPDFAGMAATLAKEEEAKKAGPSAPPPTPVVAPVAVGPTKPDLKKGGKGTAHARKPPPTAPPPLSAKAPTPEQLAEANRFGDSTQREVRVPTSTSGASRSSTPAQADISRVVKANVTGIQTCYQRALLRDNSLTSGKIMVHVSIGLSGKVKKVSLDAPAPFRALEPCIRDVTSRWAFPPSSEEYGTEFPVLLQSGSQ
jgi:hypothetical protein